MGEKEEISKWNCEPPRSRKVLKILEYTEEIYVYWVVKIRTPFVEMCGCELPGVSGPQKGKEEGTGGRWKKQRLGKSPSLCLLVCNFHNKVDLAVPHCLLFDSG
jgi:hypothetical protein